MSQRGKEGSRGRLLRWELGKDTGQVPFRGDNPSHLLPGRPAYRSEGTAPTVQGGTRE